MALLVAIFAIGCDGDHGTATLTAQSASTAPTVTSTVPANGATGVLLNRSITATFSMPMDATTLTTATFKVTGPGPVFAPVVGTVTYAGQIATFTPTSPLTASTLYAATITTGASSLSGVAKVADYNWTFTTGLTADTTAPTLTLTGAADGEIGLPVNRNATATFSEPMDPATLASPATNFTLTLFGDATAIPGTVTYIGNTATYNPTSDLLPMTQYTTTVTTAATDLAGNPLVAGLRPNPWSWTTGALADVTSPTITVTNPADLATNVPVGQKVNATFSEDMDPATMLTTNYSLKETVSNNNVTGTVAYDVPSRIATFSPSVNLTADTDYTATVTNGVTDLAGNPLVAGLAANPWTFRTELVIVPPPALAIDLGAAVTYGIASRGGLTSSGLTVVNGDVALYANPACTDSTGGPGGASADCTNQKIWTTTTGMTVNGSIFYSGGPDDLIALQVTNDLNAAWVAGGAMVDTFPADSLGGQLGGTVAPDGKVIVPGVYTEAALNLGAGYIATFDANDDPNASFVIRVTSSFTDSGILINPSQIKLARGAQAKNIWFIVGSDATIGSGTNWYGNILAGNTVAISGGSTVTGRLLSGAAGAGAFSMTTTSPPLEPAVTINVPL